ncbi:uncharacterized protein LOC131669948 [Phymastichus coffea]|uniref:uncharacterized protein LOC131669948 n=1 Tax=Phymastichus coffea TaxID=108790 RepID=UPI00273C7C3B|nr:uncharacterized protein LOC131669948 [Phymastichus coffea]
MLVSKLTVLALALYVALQQCDAIYWHTKYFQAPMNNQTGMTLVFDRRTFTDARVPYAACYPGDLHKLCTVRRFKRIYGKDQEKIYQCNVTIEATKKHSLISNKMRLVPFGEDRAILAYLEKTQFQTFLGVISVTLNGCKQHRLPDIYQINDDIINEDYEFEMLALPSDDSEYHVVYRNSKLCGDDYCKFRVDPERNIIHGPERWFSTGFQRLQQIVELVSFRTKYHKFLILEIGHGMSQFSLINEHNEVKVLDIHKRHSNDTSDVTSDSEIPFKAWTLAYTTANERVGICNLLYSKLDCVQYDEFGVKVYNAEHRFGKIDDMWISAMHNLPGGNGILVLLIDNVYNRYKVLHFDANGMEVGRLYVKDFDCNWNENAIAAQFFEENGGYCVSLACYDTSKSSSAKKDKRHVHITTEQFLLSELELTS